MFFTKTIYGVIKLDELYTFLELELIIIKKTHTASITSGPKAYETQEKKTSQKVIEMDCRGLEFTEFKPDVRRSLLR